ncbi:MAG: SH3 domain-containing protein [Saprospiraceae bacterium]|nr:SH3 domain-containing protein [Saprospiraceae bacterium]
MKRILFILLFFTLFITGAIANTTEPALALEKAQQAFDSADYQEAIEEYTGLLKAGYQSAELYYNLGTSYYQSSDLASAILNLERAKRLAPRDKDIQNNLEIALGATKNELIPLPAFFLSRGWQSVFNFFSLRTWTIGSLFVLFCSIAGGIIWLLARQPRWRRGAFWFGVGMFLLALVCFAAAKSHGQWEKDNSLAVLMERQASLQSEPSADSPVVREVYSGLLVEVIGFEGVWYQVSLQNGEHGWLPAEILERI